MKNEARLKNNRGCIASLEQERKWKTEEDAMKEK